MNISIILTNLDFDEKMNKKLFLGSAYTVKYLESDSRYQVTVNPTIPCIIS